MIKVLSICGPTCVGKTDVSIKLAKLLNGEVINGDSMQVYKEMNIGTAKIREEEKDGVAHHLFDILSVTEDFSVSDFQKIVREKIKEVADRGHLPIIVGGTGLYLKAALYDYEFSEKESKDYGLEGKSKEELYELLASLDPKTAQTIHPNNVKRVIRAIEVFYETGIGKVEVANKQTHKPIYDVLYLGLTRNREDLYKLIDKRVDIMMEKGLLEEVKKVAKIAPQNSTSMQAIGYKEYIPFINNESTLEECVEKVKSNTHKFVKRQYTWFNHQMDVKWVEVDNKDMSQIVNDAMNIIGEWNHE